MSMGSCFYFLSISYVYFKFCVILTNTNARSLERLMMNDLSPTTPSKMPKQEFLLQFYCCFHGSFEFNIMYVYEYEMDKILFFFQFFNELPPGSKKIIKRFFFMKTKYFQFYGSSILGVLLNLDCVVQTSCVQTFKHEKQNLFR